VRGVIEDTVNRQAAPGKLKYRTSVRECSQDKSRKENTRKGQGGRGGKKEGAKQSKCCRKQTATAGQTKAKISFKK